MSDETEMAYIARKPCGCVVAATIDSANHKKEVARDVARWIRAGCTIDRVPSDQVGELWSDCTHDKEVEQPKLL